MADVVVHCQGELQDLLPRSRRGAALSVRLAEHATAKHLVETLGVPHTEVGSLRINGRPAALGSRLQPGDRVECWPPSPALADGAPPRFAADAHLARLARYLRFIGCDTLYDPAWADDRLAATARAEQRVVLTRDRALLMRRDVDRGCWLRDDAPLAQLRQVARRYGLPGAQPGPPRCTLCNQVLATADAGTVDTRVPPRAARAHPSFWQCPECRRVYWAGSHWRRLSASVQAALAGVR